MAFQITEFSYSGKPIRVVPVGAESWFVAKDVCDALGVSWQGEKTLAKIKDEWKGVGKLPTPGGEQTVALLREPAVYKLAFRSNKAEAETFTDWLAAEVLPAIRKTGRYEAARVERQVVREDARNTLRVRYAKLALVNVVMRLEELGVNASAINLADVVRFGRSLQSL